MEKLFDLQLRKAIAKHGDEHVDIMVEDDKVYGFYHSSNNSTPVTDTFTLKDVGGMENLRKYEDEFIDLCICEE